MKLSLFSSFHVLISGVIPGIELLRVIIPVSQSQPGTYPPFRCREIFCHEIITQGKILSLVPAILFRVPQRVRGLEIVIIFQPLIHRTVIIILLVVRVCLRILVESHDRVLVIRRGQREFVRELEFRHPVNQIYITTKHAPVRLLHHPGNPVIPRSQSKQEIPFTSLHVE